MSFKNTLKREYEVAFSKRSQPVWFRVAKYFLLGVIVYLLWGTRWLWITLGIMVILALVMHFWVRYKTNGWKKSYGLWDYEKNKPRDP
jgi:hypothetical protein